MKIIFILISNFQKQLFPDWLSKQEDFQKLRDTKGNYGVNDIFEICSKRIVERTEFEHGFVFEYLKNRIEWFSSNFNRETLTHCAAKLGAKRCKSGEKIYENHSIGTEMYIIYNGQVGLYSGGNIIHKVIYNNVISEKVIENNQVRDHAAIALTD